MDREEDGGCRELFIESSLFVDILSKDEVVFYNFVLINRERGLC